MIESRLEELGGPWSLSDLARSPGYVGALAVPGAAPRVEPFSFAFEAEA